MNDFSYDQVLLQQDGPDDGPGLARGLVIGLLIAIPLWALIGSALVWVLQDGLINESASLALMIAAVCEAVLVRHALRGVRPRLWRHRIPALPKFPENIARREPVRGISGAALSGKRTADYLEQMTGRRITSLEDLLRFVSVPSAVIPTVDLLSRSAPVRQSTLRQTVAFAALAIVYLHYYFWDVNLQIASLHSVTVFVAVTPLQKFAT